MWDALVAQVVETFVVRINPDGISLSCVNLTKRVGIPHAEVTLCYLKVQTLHVTSFNIYVYEASSRNP